MSTTKHTEGPWYIGSEGVVCGYANVYAGENENVLVASVWADDVSRDVCAANANLAIAAPALADALAFLIDAIHNYGAGKEHGPMLEALAKGRAALAKARPVPGDARED